MSRSEKEPRGRRKPASPKLHSIEGVQMSAPSVENLTSDEVRLVRLFRATSDKCQRMVLATLEHYKDDPLLARTAPKPTLRLVDGGAHGT